MAAFAWDPDAYRQFDDARSRPFRDLIGRIATSSPREVVDLGCGPGHLTAVLAERWPGADVLGTDNSAEMLAAASVPGVRFELADVRTWIPTPRTDVAVCNAVLQWVPDHAPLVQRWAAAMPVGGWVALQVPGNFDAASHTLMRTVAADGFPAAAAALRHADPVLTPAGYATLLLDAGLVADAWETTYVHVLDGPDPVLRWVRGTGLRPALAALSPVDAVAFEAAYAAALRAAYPPRADGTTLFEFRRIFAVGEAPVITGFDHVQLAVPVGSEPSLREFYGDLLGMTELPKPRCWRRGGGCWFGSGAAVLHLGVEDPFAPARKAHPAFLVADLDALQRRLESAGYPCERTDGQVPGVRRFHTHDVVGNRIEFQQMIL